MVLGTSEVEVRERVSWIDGARGLSIVLMMLSHLSLTFGIFGAWFHWVLMRPVAPIFLLLFAMLWRPGLRRSHLRLFAAAPIAQALAYLLGFPVPDILLVICGAVLVMPVVQRWPIPVTILAVTQLAFWPIPGWDGYPVGFVLVLLVVGSHLDVGPALTGYGRVGSWLGLDAIGRHPLPWYLGHLGGLVVLVLVLV